MPDKHQPRPNMKVFVQPTPMHACWKCHVVMAKADLQAHLNAEHPGWDREILRKLGKNRAI